MIVLIDFRIPSPVIMTAITGCGLTCESGTLGVFNVWSPSGLDCRPKTDVPAHACVFWGVSSKAKKHVCAQNECAQLTQMYLLLLKHLCWC